MLKKVWFMFVLWSVLMVSGCSGGMKKDNTESVAVTDDVVILYEAKPQGKVSDAHKAWMC